ncbi:putative bifunctional diguanylate cyclase/phosphodiesterase [Pseudoduganella sp. GCM10020061]|uniref:putative bifunctional diguanylate cyclase/phosphodiesterase n=1 Tax=Pseudoduganella sp. GCM10020061 TaxID=3317345 RepID=UPI00364421C7
MNDDAASLTALESVLSGQDRAREYQLVRAGSGQDALRQVLIHDFAVILLDVDMPDMDGFETARAIHSHPRSAHVPIIFITAYYADELHKVEGYGMGAVDYLFTPLVPRILQAKVAVFVELARKNAELLERTGELEQLYRNLKVQRVRELERANRVLEQEVAERRLAEQRAHELSIRDPLTGLVNRRALIAQLEHAVASAERHDTEFALLYLDLDRFKQVNDTLGHEVGDQLLREVASRLTAAVRASDVVARLGGDEFVILLEGRGAHQNAARVARKIEQAHTRPFDIGAKPLACSASIGIALYPQDGVNATLLMQRADSAMYFAKQKQRGGIAFFCAEQDQQENERTRLVGELHEALELGQLELYYAPRAAVASGHLTGIEALPYWNHPRHGLVAASGPLAEANDRGLQERFNEWAMRELTGHARQWRSSLPALPLALNLEFASLVPESTERLLRQLADSGLPEGWLELEVGAALLEDGSAASQLRELSGAGARLALDGFGRSAFSLATLQQAPLALVKMDPSFVEGIGHHPGGADLVAAIIHMAHALKLSAVAEGVSTQEQLDTLRLHECDQYQGDLLSPPLPAHSVPEFAAVHNYMLHPTIPRNEDLVNE